MTGLCPEMAEMGGLEQPRLPNTDHWATYRTVLILRCSDFRYREGGLTSRYSDENWSVESKTREPTGQ